MIINFFKTLFGFAPYCKECGKPNSWVPTGQYDEMTGKPEHHWGCSNVGCIWFKGSIDDVITAENKKLDELLQ
jgi:hypothetical protein